MHYIEYRIKYVYMCVKWFVDNLLTDVCTFSVYGVIQDSKRAELLRSNFSRVLPAVPGDGNALCYMVFAPTLDVPGV